MLLEILGWKITVQFSSVQFPGGSEVKASACNAGAGSSLLHMGFL